MTGIEKLRNLSATLGERQPFALERIYIDDKTASEWLADVADQIERETLPRPRFEDGEPVQFGDEFVVSINTHKAQSFTYYSDGRITVDSLFGSAITPIKRPEPPDTWERIEADVDKGSACRYFGVADSEEECGKCAAQLDDGDMSCGESMARDVLRRCKALAGVE